MARKAKPVKHARRKRGKGTVHLRKDGRWQWSYMYNGKRYTGYATSYEEADRLVLAAIADVQKNGFVSQRITVDEWLEEWVKTKEIDGKANSLDIWGRAVRDRLIPALRGIALDDLKRSDVQSLVNAWASEGLKPNTIKTYFSPLHTAIIEAIQSDIIAHNPCNYIKFPKQKHHDDEEEQKALDIDQGKRLLLQMEGHRIRPLVLLALATGLRCGELLALKWKDIDFKAGKLQVRRNVAQIPGKGHIEDSPKTKSGKRTISLPDFALSMLKEHRIEQNAKRLETDDWKDLDLVFCRKDGTHLNKDTPGYYLHIALKEAGLPDMSFHKLRHSAGSILLALGVEITVVSKILGHANPGITMTVYAHMLPHKDEQAMIRYNDAYWQSESEKRAN